MLLILISWGVAFGLSALLKHLLINSAGGEVSASLDSNVTSLEAAQQEDSRKEQLSVLAALSISLISVLLGLFVMFLFAIWYFDGPVQIKTLAPAAVSGYWIYKWLRKS